MIGDRWHRRVFLVLIVVLGLPTLVVGGLLAALSAGMGTAFWAMGGIEAGDGVFLTAWGCLGMAGLLGGARLSVAMLVGSVAALSRVRWPWWSMLIAGVVAALPLAVLLVYLAWTGDFSTGFPWPALFFGPLVLVPALHLLYLRITCHRRIAPGTPEKA